MDTSSSQVSHALVLLACLFFAFFICVWTGVNFQNLNPTIKRLTDAGFKVHDSPKMREETTKLRLRWLQALCDRLDQRFPQMPQLSALSQLFHPAHMPVRGSDIGAYGHAALDVLIPFYAPGGESKERKEGKDGKEAKEGKEGKERKDGKEEKAAEEKAAKPAKKKKKKLSNFELRKSKGNVIDPAATRAEWQVFRRVLVQWRDQFDDAASKAKADSVSAAAKAKAIQLRNKSKQAEEKKEERKEVDFADEDEAEREMDSDEIMEPEGDSVPQLSMSAMLKRILTEGSNALMFPNLGKLAPIAVVIPVSVDSPI